MEKDQELRYVKRTQKDYSMSLKLQIVQEIEQGKTSISQVRKIMLFNHVQQLFNGFENSVTLIGTIKHLLLCKNLLNRK